MLIACLASLAGLGCPSSTPPARSVALAAGPLPEDAPPALRSMHARLLEQTRSQPQDPQSWMRLALLCEANAYWLQAAEAFERAESLATEDPLLSLHAAYARWWIQPFAVDVGVLEARARQFARCAPWKQFVGDVLLERGEIVAARALFEQAAALAPERPEPRAGLGECALEEQHFAAAVEHLEGALRLDPGYKAARYMLGLALQGCEREDEGRRELARGAGGRKRRMPDRLTRLLEPLTLDFERVLGLAAEWIESGRAAQGEALLRQHAERNDRDPRLATNLGVARMRQRDPLGAVEWFDAALKLEPRSYFAQVNRSACMVELRRFDEALRAAQAAVEVAPAAARAHLTLARARAVLGDSAGAADAAQRAVELEPRDPAARQALGQALLDLGEDQRALTHFEAQRDLLPHQWQTHAELASASAAAGNLAQAQAALERALGLAPNQPELLELAFNLGFSSR